MIVPRVGYRPSFVETARKPWRRSGFGWLMIARDHCNLTDQPSLLRKLKVKRFFLQFLKGAGISTALFMGGIPLKTKMSPEN